MPKRIQLPSADALFAEPTATGRERGGAAVRGRSAPRPRHRTADGPATGATPHPQAAAAEPVRREPAAAPSAASTPARGASGSRRGTARTATTPASRARKPAHRSRTARSTRAQAQPATRGTTRRTTAVRIQRLEARLGALPIDSLLELRDELEALLVAPELRNDEVDRLLATAGV